ncbi:MAG: SipW-dependent-type signal peptide-containing protein [Bifidobacteriaceae bacterium]|jgi:predicted ribosomally synthesized peptide with SipW-like signal peptide|nr:SipW-dependent-type signal peptide-containing protein [Bifidobacteriaceae bacterium]
MATSRKSSRRVKGLVAGACGAALLMAGGTWALWYDEQQYPGAKIVAGNLDLGVEQPVLYDTSYITGVNKDDATHAFQQGADSWRDDAVVTDPQAPSTYVPGFLDVKYPLLDGTDLDLVKGHVIQTTSATPWTASPGDTFTGLLPLVVALQGDNLVADLKLVTNEKPIVASKIVRDASTTIEPIIDFSLDVYVRTSTGTTQKVATNVSIDQLRNAQAGKLTLPLARLQADNESRGSLEPSIPVVSTKAVPASITHSDFNAVIVVKGTLNPHLTKQELARATATDGANQTLVDIKAFSVVLEQTRQDGVGNF